jgi:hypothetical protein
MIAPDGRIVRYGYDEQGRLVSVRNLSLGQSERYSYDAQGRLLLTPDAVISYQGATAQVLGISQDLGGATSFNGVTTSGTLGNGESKRYVFNVRQSEIMATANQQVLLSVDFSAKSAAIPQIAGLTPVATRINGDRAVALFAIAHEGLYLLEINGSGNYSLKLAIAGDTNRDGRVDGVDSQAVMAGLGKAYNPSLDSNLDGVVSGLDVQVVGANLGFMANLAPVVQTTSALTHTDLTVTIPLENLVSDGEGDTVSYRVVNPVHGTINMSPDGTGAVFSPTAGYAGDASFAIIADDGFNSSAPIQVSVKVSGAALLSLDFVERNPEMYEGEQKYLEVIGDFADQEDVYLPASYLTWTSTNTNASLVDHNGLLTAQADGYGVIIVNRHHIQAATSFSVGEFSDSLQEELYLSGIDAYPQAITLPSFGASRQIKVGVLGEEFTLNSASSGTQYFIGNSSVVEVTPDGLAKALVTNGETTITVTNRGTEFVIPVKIIPPSVGATSIGVEGGAVQGSDGSPGFLTKSVIAKAESFIP